jgi:hypothetical protein
VPVSKRFRAYGVSSELPLPVPFGIVLLCWLEVFVVLVVLVVFVVLVVVVFVGLVAFGVFGGFVLP